MLDDWNALSTVAEHRTIDDASWRQAAELLSHPVDDREDQTWSAAAQRWLALTAIEPSQVELLRALRRQLITPAEFDPRAMDTLQRRSRDSRDYLYVCSGPGNLPLRTSSRYCTTAPPMIAFKSA